MKLCKLAGLVLIVALLFIGCAAQPQQTPGPQGPPPQVQRRIPLPCNVTIYNGKPQVFCGTGGITVPSPF